MYNWTLSWVKKFANIAVFSAKVLFRKLMLYFRQFAKVFTCKNFRLYGNLWALCPNSYLFDLFLEVSHSALSAVPLDETFDGIASDGEMIVRHTCFTAGLRYEVALQRGEGEVEGGGREGEHEERN